MPRCSLNGVAVIAGKFGDDLQESGTVVLHWLPVAVEPCLVLGTQHGHSGLEVRQAVPDVVHEESAEGFGQVLRASAGGQRGVVALQEGVLVPHRILQALLGIDVMLAPVRNAN